MNFPYGIADFYQLITEGCFYADRTGHIPLIEKAGKQLLFLRPRRFGKSLLLSMLENYYDLSATRRGSSFITRHSRSISSIIFSRNASRHRTCWMKIWRWMTGS
jgi:hypothetical protein